MGVSWGFPSLTAKSAPGVALVVQLSKLGKNRRETLLPFATFGGAADQVYAEELQTFGQNYSDRLERLEFELLKSRKDAAGHATNIIALAEKVAQSRSVTVVMSYDDRARTWRMPTKHLSVFVKS